MQTVEAFLMRYPMFKDTDPQKVGFFMDDAKAEVDAKRWGKLYQRGLFALTAHLLQMADETVANDGGAVREAQSETAGSLSVSYVATVPPADGSTYHLTAYGQEYVRLQKLVGVGFMVLPS